MIINWNRKIRLQNKHIMGGLALLLLLIFFVGPAIAGEILWAQARSSETNGDRVKALAYYDKLIQSFPKHHRIPDALFWSSKLVNPQESFRVFLFPNHSSASHSGKPEDLANERKEFLTQEERLLTLLGDYPDHDLTVRHAHMDLGELLYEQRRYDEAKIYLQDVLMTGPDWRKAEAGLLLAKIYKSQGYYKEGLDIAERILTNYPNQLNTELLFMKGDLLALLDRKDEAREIYQSVVPQFEKEEQRLWERDGDHHPRDENVFDHTKEYLTRRVEEKMFLLTEGQAGEIAVVTGNIQGLTSIPQGLQVLLVRKLDAQGQVSPPPEEHTQRDVVDEKGRFSFEQVTPGQYELGLELNYHQAKQIENLHLQIINGEFTLGDGDTKETIFNFVPTIQQTGPSLPFTLTDEELTVEWEEYPPADHYSVTIDWVELRDGGNFTSTSHIRQDGIKGTSYRFGEKEFRPPFGVFQIDSEGVSPPSVLGVLRGADYIRIHIRAHDNAGKVLSSSQGLRFAPQQMPEDTLIKIEPLPLSLGDQLILKRKYDDAILVYEESLVDNPGDIHSRDVLSRLYAFGTNYDYDEGKGKFVNENQNQEKAAIHLDYLYQLTGDNIYLERLDKIKQSH